MGKDTKDDTTGEAADTATTDEVVVVAEVAVAEDVANKDAGEPTVEDGEDKPKEPEAEEKGGEEDDKFHDAAETEEAAEAAATTTEEAAVEEEEESSKADTKPEEAAKAAAADAGEEDAKEDAKEAEARAPSARIAETIIAAEEMRVAEEEEESRPAIWEPAEEDVLSGRGASVNAHGGNKKFRALCFARKPEFEAGNHAAKRRIATEIVAVSTNTSGKFLKKKIDKGPWYEMTNEQAILKACQVMRDYKRPDRLAIREMMAQNGSARKRSRQQESTPMLVLDTVRTVVVLLLSRRSS
jgi:hypothetical protein